VRKEGGWKGDRRRNSLVERGVRNRRVNRRIRIKTELDGTEEPDQVSLRYETTRLKGREERGEERVFQQRNTPICRG